ncbi:hypothetical protein [Streptomyces sp. NBC_01304]|uniref:hypothetical protein n=1 Tax=Streptomyces sp. NBC_01304 TaxID=2903818 RepID=UPI002E138A29|nr:hypothetical protein OG430_10145 [Streptomyces sp. NBC_01304]
MFHDGLDDGLDDGFDLGDEELMTVQGLDGYGAYGAYGCAMCGYGDCPGDGTCGQYEDVAGYGQPAGMGQYGQEEPLGWYGETDELGHTFQPQAAHTARCVPGEVRRGRDGRLYEWVEGYDGLGSPVGFWSLIPALAKTVLPLAARYLPQVLRAVRGRRPPRMLPPAMQYAAPTPLVAPMPPAPEAPPGEGDELNGFGYGYGYGEGPADEPLAEGEEPGGTGDYVPGPEGNPGQGGVEGYVRERRPRTRAFRRPVQAPELWRPLW